MVRDRGEDLDQMTEHQKSLSPDNEVWIRCLGCGVLIKKNDERVGKIVGLILYGQAHYLTLCRVCREMES